MPFFPSTILTLVLYTENEGRALNCFCHTAIKGKQVLTEFAFYVQPLKQLTVIASVIYLEKYTTYLFMYFDTYVCVHIHTPFYCIFVLVWICMQTSKTASHIKS